MRVDVGLRKDGAKGNLAGEYHDFPGRRKIQKTVS